MKFNMLLFLVFLSFGVIAQDENECITEFTQGYFDWLRNAIRNPNHGSLREYSALEQVKFAKLLTFIDEFEVGKCSSDDRSKINELYKKTLHIHDLHKQLNSEIKRGKALVMDNNMRKSRTSYKMYGAKLVRELRKQTGVKW